MNNQFMEARELIAQAREALRRSDKASARQLGEQAALLAPNMEDVWLVLTASDPNPEEALAYARKALELSPQSGRAHRAVEWASGRLKEAQSPKEPAPQPSAPNQVEAAASLPKKHAYQTAVALPQLQSKGRNWLLPALLSGAACMFIGLVVFLVLIAEYPALASFSSSVRAPSHVQENLWAPVDIAKPEAPPIGGNVLAVQAADTPTSAPTEAAPTSVPTKEPTLAPTEAPALQALTPQATETPGSLAMEAIQDTPTSESPAYNAPNPPVASGSGTHWIDVDLTNQRVYAYEGDTVVNSFLVSTGTWLHPTVTGQYKVYIKLRYGNMSGPDYFLPNVPYIMYFYKSYGLHGTYWHHNFGTPMSHGCVNLQTDDAAWLYNWSSIGTIVNVHY